jgi:hypothetical protein
VLEPERVSGHLFRVHAAVGYIAATGVHVGHDRVLDLRGMSRMSDKARAVIECVRLVGCSKTRGRIRFELRRPPSEELSRHYRAAIRQRDDRDLSNCARYRDRALNTAFDSSCLADRAVGRRQADIHYRPLRRARRNVRGVNEAREDIRRARGDGDCARRAAFCARP